MVGRDVANLGARRAEVVTQLLFGSVLHSGPARCEAFLECDDPPPSAASVLSSSLNATNTAKQNRDQIAASKSPQTSHRHSGLFAPTEITTSNSAFLVLAVARPRPGAGNERSLVCLFRFADPDDDRPLECIDVCNVFPDIGSCVLIVSSGRSVSAFQNSWVLRLASMEDTSSWIVCITDVLAGRLKPHMETVARVRSAAASLDNVVNTRPSSTTSSSGSTSGEGREEERNFAKPSKTISKPPLRASRSVPELSCEFSTDHTKIVSAAMRDTQTQKSRCTSDVLQTDLQEILEDIENAKDLVNSRLAKKASAGALATNSLRTVAWRIFLGILPQDPNEWAPSLARQRRSVDVLASRHIMTRGMVFQQLELLVQDSLTPDYIGSALCQLHFELARHELTSREIWKDITRTKVVHDCFSGPPENAVRETMLRLLLVWAKANPHIGYRQGMNELLAVVFVTLQSEYTAAAGGLADALVPKPASTQLRLLSTLLNPDSIEHDAYLLLDALMKRLQPFFKLTENSNSNVSLVTSLPAKLEHIQHVLLQRTDPELAAQLHVLGVEPSFFLLRWIRLILARDIPLPQLLLVWDAVFALTPEDFSLIDVLCIAILTDPGIVRNALIKADDCVVALQAVKRLPALADDQVLQLVHSARHVKLDYEIARANLEKALAQQQELDSHNTNTSIDASASESPFTSSNTHSHLPAEYESDDDWIQIDTLAGFGGESGDESILAMSSSPHSASPRTPLHNGSGRSSSLRRFQLGVLPGEQALSRRLQRLQSGASRLFRGNRVQK